MIEDLAIVVSRSRYSETSFLVTWLTRENGILRTIAKGAARPRQPLYGKIDLYYSGILAYHPGRGSLHRVGQFEPSHTYREVGIQYNRSLCAAYCYEVIEHLVEREHGIPELYDLYTKALAYLETHEPTWEVVERFEKRTFHLLGIHRPGESHDLLRRQALPRLPRTYTRLREILRQPATD